MGLLSEPTNLNLYRRSRHFTCPPFLSRFGAVKPYFPFSVSSPSVDLGAPGLLSLFQLLFLFHQCLLPTSASSDLSKHIRLLSFPFRHCCSKTFITFRMSTAFFLHLFLNVGLTARPPQPLSALWAFHLPFPLRFGAIKPPVPF